MRQDQVDGIFDNWVLNGLPSDTAIQQLQKVAEATDDKNILIDVDACIETIQANR